MRHEIRITLSRPIKYNLASESEYRQPNVMQLAGMCDISGEYVYMTDICWFWLLYLSKNDTTFMGLGLGDEFDTSDNITF